MDRGADGGHGGAVGPQRAEEGDVGRDRRQRLPVVSEEKSHKLAHLGVKFCACQP